jgi:hypothetical protein
MKKNEIAYINIDLQKKQLVRAEVWSMPFFVLLPLFFSLWLLWRWYIHDSLHTTQTHTGELILGLIILIGNLIFDIPFVNLLIQQMKKSR